MDKSSDYFTINRDHYNYHYHLKFGIQPDNFQEISYVLQNEGCFDNLCHFVGPCFKFSSPNLYPKSRPRGKRFTFASHGSQSGQARCLRKWSCIFREMVRQLFLLLVLAANSATPIFFQNPNQEAQDSTLLPMEVNWVKCGGFRKGLFWSWPK